MGKPKKSQYSPMKVMRRIWVDGDSRVVYESDVMIDLEDVEVVEDYKDVNEYFEPQFELSHLTLYSGNGLIVMVPFKLMCSLVKEARESQKKSKGLFLN